MIAPLTSSVASPSFAGLAQSPRQIAQLPQPDQVKAAAGQFEAILLRQFLQESVGKIMGGEGSGGGVYSYMLTDVLAAKLTEGGGLGLGGVIEQQLSPRHPAFAVTDASNTSQP